MQVVSDVEGITKLVYFPTCCGRPFECRCTLCLCTSFLFGMGENCSSFSLTGVGEFLKKGGSIYDEYCCRNGIPPMITVMAVETTVTEKDAAGLGISP